MENKLTQQEFLKLFPGTRFRYIHDVDKDTVQGNSVLDLSWNKKGYGVFFTVNGFPPTGKADESRLLSLNASYVDFDVASNLSQEEKSRLIQDVIMSGMEAGVQSPTIINRTQKGVHLMWLYREPLKPTAENIAKWREVQIRLVDCFKGDRAATDPSRVLRVPYTLHLKDPRNPYEIQIQSYKPEARCTLDELGAAVPQYSGAEIVTDKTSAKDLLRNGVEVGKGLRHMATAQVVGVLLKDAKTPEQIQTARMALYWWDREIVQSPEPFHQRKKELDNTISGILKRELISTGQQVNSIKSRALTVRASEVKPEPISWLWNGRIALGKLSVFSGDPGLGKSLVASGSLAAIVSTGGKWPIDNSVAPIGDVVLLSAEDDPADTIRPRLDAAGADCNRIHILQAIKDVDDKGKPTQRMFSLKRDITALEELLKTLPSCKLVVVDPISAYLDGADSHNNTDVRGLLAPLAELAARYKVAVVLIQHLNKSAAGNALYRSIGSIAFIAAARAAYIVTKDKENPLRRLFMPVKNNLAQDTTGLAYSVVAASNGAPMVVWEEDPVLITADEALGQADSNDDRTETDWGVVFLESILAEGPIAAKQLHKEAKEAGVKDKALRRAQEKLNIKPYRLSFDGGWWWKLTKREDALKDEDAL